MEASSQIGSDVRSGWFVVTRSVTKAGLGWAVKARAEAMLCVF